MKRLHLIVGILVVVVFLLTGQYMKFYYPGMDQVPDGLRMMLRSRHIYLLMSGLLNIAIGTYLDQRGKGWRKIFQLTGSSLVLISPVALAGAFFYEPVHTELGRTLTLPGVVSLFAGTLLHMVGGRSRGKDSAGGEKSVGRGA
jgi:hypothetical protein